MGFRNPTAPTTTFIGPFPASGAETIVFTTPPISPPADNQVVLIAWELSVTMGTTGTSLSFFLRRGPALTSTLMTYAGGQQVGIAAGSLGFGCGLFVDSPGVVAGQQYSLTVIQNGVTAASVFRDGGMWAICL